MVDKRSDTWYFEKGEKKEFKKQLSKWNEEGKIKRIDISPDGKKILVELFED